MKPGSWIDLALCIAVLPALLVIFPIEEWAGWNAVYVLVCVGWMYLNYFLHRRVSALMLLSPGRKMVPLCVALVFISGVVTFLIGIYEPGIPREITEKAPRLDPHQQALWILFVVTTFSGLAIGVMDTLYRQLEAFKQETQAENTVRGEVDLRGSEAVGGKEVTVKSGYQTVHIPLSDIQYAESRGNYVCIHRDHGEDVVTQMTLKTFNGMLPEGKFLRIHRSFLIPAWRIQSRSALSVRLVGVDRDIPVGRAHKENLK